MIKLGLILLIAPCLLLMGLYLPEQWQVADCLDAGRAYDYQRQLCGEAQSYPYIPFMARHSSLVNSSMLLSVLGLILCIIGLYRPAKR